jgi:dienelactone hydrolase
MKLMLLNLMLLLVSDDGRYAASPLKPWFESLRNGWGQSCCDLADGISRGQRLGYAWWPLSRSLGQRLDCGAGPGCGARAQKGAELFKQVDGAKMLQDFLAAAAWLKSHPNGSGKLGAVGFCFGGGVVNQLAVRMGTDLSAAVPFYGVQPSAEDTAKIGAPLLAHYGELDTRITSGWPAFDEALTAAHVPHEGYVYSGANHGFYNDTTPRYDQAAAKLAWQRTLNWFNKYLRAPNRT